MRLFLTATRYEHAGLYVHFVLPFFLLSKRLKEAFRDLKNSGSWVTEATLYKFEVKSNLQGHWQLQKPFLEKDSY